MKKYMYLALIIMIGSLQSCSEYLEESNPNFLSTDTYWTTLDESNANLTSVYGAMLDQYVLGIELEFLRSDIAYPGQRTNNTGAYLPWYQQTLTADNDDVADLWDSKYRVIWRANQVIEGLNGMSETLKSNPRWTEQMAQARFFRGLMHFYLHATFNEGKIIIRDFVPKTTQDFNKSLSTSDEVKTFFRDDLEYAYQNLPPQMEPKTRADAGAAATILGTSYLYDGNYPKAKDYFNDIINNVNGDYGYQLVQDVVNLMFTNAGGFNSESILEINYSTDHQLEDGNFDEESFFHRYARYTGPNGSNQETGDNFGSVGWLLPSAWLTYGLSNEPMDTQDPRNYDNGVLRNIPLRGSQSIAVVNDESSIYYGYKAPQVSNFGGTRFSFFKKYTNHDIVTNEFETGTIGWKSGRNVVVNRLGGVYLMYAECLAKTGDINGAIFYINELRQRWGLQLLGIANGSLHDFDGIVYDETSLMDHLMYKEYPYELGFEGFTGRFLDMRRWGISKQRFNDLSTQVFSLSRYTYTSTNGNSANRNNSLLVQGSGALEFVEYEGAASSWNAKDLGYYQIPKSETLYNPNVN